MHGNIFTVKFLDSCLTVREDICIADKSLAKPLV